MNDEHTNERQRLLAALLGPPGPELSCDDCFDLLDRYVDLELAGVDAEAAVPGMQAHLEGCPACREDHESLTQYVVLSAASGEDPAA